MKAVIVIEDELVENIKSEVKNGEFQSANEFINHAIKEYIKNKNKKFVDNTPSIDELIPSELSESITRFQKSRANSSVASRQEVYQTDYLVGFEKIDFKAMNELSPITDIRSDKKYREHATKVLIRQIVKDCIMKTKKA